MCGHALFFSFSTSFLFLPFLFRVQELLTKRIPSSLPSSRGAVTPSERVLSYMAPTDPRSISYCIDSLGVRLNPHNLRREKVHTGVTFNELAHLLALFETLRDFVFQNTAITLLINFCQGGMST